jgi:acetyl-CoA carboxylase biotin carboxyl carrier protein
LTVDFEQLKQILNLVRDHELSEFEIEQEGLRLRVRTDAARGPAAAAAHPAPSSGGAMPTTTGPHSAITPGGHSQTAGVPETADAGDTEIELAVLKSPIVGTFYRSPEPGAPAFVEIGSMVKTGQVLCIIEAMKLMNEIDSEYDGEIVNIHVENGQPVQYGERLFAIKTS